MGFVIFASAKELEVDVGREDLVLIFSSRWPTKSTILEKGKDSGFLLCIDKTKIREE